MGINIFMIFVPFNQIITTKAKYIIAARMLKLLLKKFSFFSLQYIRMSGKNINFDYKKKIKKSEFHKHKRVFQMDDIDVSKIHVLKKNHTAQRMRLIILLNTMIMMLLGHYV